MRNKKCFWYQFCYVKPYPDEYLIDWIVKGSRVESCQCLLVQTFPLFKDTLFSHLKKLRFIEKSLWIFWNFAVTLLLRKNYYYEIPKSLANESAPGVINQFTFFPLCVYVKKNRSSCLFRLAHHVNESEDYFILLCL